MQFVLDTDTTACDASVTALFDDLSLTLLSEVELPIACTATGSGDNPNICMEGPQQLVINEGESFVDPWCGCS